MIIRAVRNADRSLTQCRFYSLMNEPVGVRF
jgi:hypothetical protein